METITTGLPLTEQLTSPGKNVMKNGESKISFDGLLQERLTPSAADKKDTNSKAGNDRQSMMALLSNTNVQKQTIIKQAGEHHSTFEQLSDADLLDVITTMSAGRNNQDDILIPMDQKQLPQLFNRLSMLRDQLDQYDDNLIETIISVFLEGMDRDSEIDQAERSELSQTETGDISSQDVLELLDHLFTGTDTTNVHPKQLVDLTKFMLAVDSNNPAQQQKTITAQAQKMINHVKNHQDAAQAAKPLLMLAEAWTILEKEQQPMKNSDSFDRENDLIKQDRTVWRKLTKLFQNQPLSEIHKHHSVNESNMKQKVINVLLNAHSESGGDKQSVHTSHSLSMLPMSKVEQFVIHLQQQANNQTVDQQLISQFEKAMKTSKFFTGDNGTSQLHLRIKPDNLGDMAVKVTQMNGEMTVKIAVSAQATKDMLESNIHQLKHLFSPNQVVIEKQDAPVEAPNFNDEETGQPMQEQEQENHDHHQENNQQDQQQEDTDISFHEWLMNEKV